jgi:erythromycin esterase-like protein
MARAAVSQLIREVAEPIDIIENAQIGALLERISDSRIVLLGEATHGTSEFYRMRARITSELVTRCGFNIVAVEADWPDGACVDRYIRRLAPLSRCERAFDRFPTWMWRNREFASMTEWLRQHNALERSRERQVSFHGLDLYSLHTSIERVLGFLDDIDPDTAATAREQYGCLDPWQRNPATYGRLVLTGRFRECESAVTSMLTALLGKRLEYGEHDSERTFDAAQNAKLIANAERYYRVMYYGSRESWNLRDQHMFETLESVLAFRGPDSKAVVWEHNSHVGNAAATEMGDRGEHNVGELCRQHFGDKAYLVGFGTDHGTVAAATEWDEPMEIKTVRPSHSASYEFVCHGSDVPAFMMHLRNPARPSLRSELMTTRLERAIGVIYRPETELQSHYFGATLPEQFDEYIWFDETRAVSPLVVRHSQSDVPETFPFGL